MVQQPLDMFNPQQMFPIHRNDDSVPDLGDQHLGFILDLHLGRSQYLGIYPLGQPGVYILPGRPNGETKGKGASDAKDDDPDDVPEIGVEKEEDEVHDVHDGERKGDVVGAEGGTKEAIAATLDGHSSHDGDGTTKGGGEKKVGFDEFTAKDEGPEQNGSHAGGARKGRVGSGKSLGGHVLSRFPGHSITKHSARRNDGKNDGDDDRDAELDHANDEGDKGETGRRETVDHGDVKSGTGSQGEDED